MTTIPNPPLETGRYFLPVPTSQYSFQELAEIYNQSRVDYIVPMPMNAKRMETYIKTYDVDLDASAVALNPAGEMCGIGMLGVRGGRAWITRLGVIPERRGNNLGSFLMQTLLDGARRRDAKLVQLEVIKGNTPAHRLFTKFGFRETRELLVIRRPPSKPTLENPSPEAIVTPLTADEIQNSLAERGPGASWIDENASLAQAGSLKGLRIQLPSGETGWIVYQNTAFQMSYIVLNTSPPARDQIALALLYHLHTLHPLQDTKVENLPALDLRWPVFQKMGYVEAFRRIEMFLYL